MGRCRKTIEIDMAMIDYYDSLIRDLERHILTLAKQHDLVTLELLQSVPGIGSILSLVCSMKSMILIGFLEYRILPPIVGW